jgi:hypothetical protein
LPPPCISKKLTTHNSQFYIPNFSNSNQRPLCHSLVRSVHYSALAHISFATDVARTLILRFFYRPFAPSGARQSTSANLFCALILFNLQSPYHLRLTTHDSRLTTHDSRLTTHDSRLTTHDSRLTTHDSRLTTHDECNFLFLPSVY